MWEGTHPDACSKAWDIGWTMKRVCQSFWNYTLRRSSEKTITCHLFPPYSLNPLPSLSNLFPLPSDGFLPGFRLLRGPSQQRRLLSGFLILSPVFLLILNSMVCVLELGPAPQAQVRPTQIWMRNGHIKSLLGRTSLVVQWLRLHSSNAEEPVWIPVQGTRSCMLQRRVCMPQPRSDILHTAIKTRCSQITKNKY